MSYRYPESSPLAELDRDARRSPAESERDEANRGAIMKHDFVCSVILRRFRAHAATGGLRLRKYNPPCRSEC
jgi:hypothetical protein